MADAINRREFLKGQGIETRGAGEIHAGQAVESGVTLVTGSPESTWPMTSISRRAMACEFSVLVNAGECPNSTPLAIEALEIAGQLEAQLSYFVDSSDVCRMNRFASTQEVLLSEEVFQLLERARQYHDMTDGAFDITASPLWRLWGFHRRGGRHPSDREIAETLQHVGMRHLQLDADRHAVRFLRPGVEVNLGGIGKGFAVDRIFERLADQGLTSFLVQAGGSSIRSQGFRAGHESDGWRINLPHPWKRDTDGITIALRDRALATSGSSQQSFHHQGVRYGHILDPRTGMPASELISATVMGSSAAAADALATACYVMGRLGSQQFCHRHQDYEAILVSASESGKVEYLRLNQANDGEL